MSNNMSNNIKKTDIDAFSIINIYTSNDTKVQSKGPQDLIPKICKNGEIYCAIPSLKYGGNAGNCLDICGKEICSQNKEKTVEDLENKKKICCNEKLPPNNLFAGINPINFKILKKESACLVYGLSTVYTSTLAMYSGRLIQNNIEIPQKWFNGLYINKININNIIPNIFRKIDSFYNIPIINPNTITLNPISNNDLNNFYFNPNIIKKQKIKYILYYGLDFNINIYKQIKKNSINFNKDIETNFHNWITGKYRNIPIATWLYNNNFYIYRDLFKVGKKKRKDYKYINYLNYKLRNNKISLLNRLINFFEILKKANEYEKKNKNICAYTPKWDYTFQCNLINKKIINDNNNKKKIKRCKNQEISMDTPEDTTEDTIKYYCSNENNENNKNNDNNDNNICNTITKDLFNHWTLYNRINWPKTPSKELSSFFQLILDSNINEISKIIQYAAEVKNDIETENKYMKKGMTYYPKYNPFHINKIIGKTIKQYTARVAWPNGSGLSYNGNNEITLS